MQSGDGSKRVFSREEFASMLMERVDDVTKVGPVVEFVVSALKLQNDMGRPVYVFEVSEGIGQEEFEYIDDVMRGLGLTCCLVPKGLMGYVGEVTCKSFGVSNLKTDILGIKDPADRLGGEGEQDAGKDA